MHLKRVTKSQDRCLIGDLVAEQLDTGKATFDRYHDQGLCHRRFPEGLPLQQQVDPLHRGQWKLRSTALFAGLVVMKIG